MISKWLSLLLSLFMFGAHWRLHWRWTSTCVMPQTPYHSTYYNEACISMMISRNLLFPAFVFFSCNWQPTLHLMCRICFMTLRTIVLCYTKELYNVKKITQGKNMCPPKHKPTCGFKVYSISLDNKHNPKLIKQTKVSQLTCFAATPTF